MKHEKRGRKAPFMFLCPVSFREKEGGFAPSPFFVLRLSGDRAEAEKATLEGRLLKQEDAAQSSLFLPSRQVTS